jgi:SAM-dependent methyltransferase
MSVDAVGIEYLSEKVAIAQQQPGLSNFIHQGDIQHIQFNDSSFDAVLLNEVIEHVPHEEQALQEIYRVLKPHGILIIFCPNRLFPFETHGVYLKGTQKKLPPYIPFVPYIPLNIGKLFLVYWARNYWPWELRTLCEKNKFTVSATYYLWQTFENISGQQPWFIRVLRPLFRGLAGFFENIPYLRQFSASQVLILQKK